MLREVFRRHFLKKPKWLTINLHGRFVANSPFAFNIIVGSFAFQNIQQVDIILLGYRHKASVAFS